MQPIKYHEYDAFAKSLSGPACCYIYDGDYDRAVLWPSGQAIDAANWGMPDWARFWRVDAVIECFDITTATRAELLRLMPNAYGGDRPKDYYGNEPDLQRDYQYKLHVIWERLSEEAKADIVGAYEKA